MIHPAGIEQILRQRARELARPQTQGGDSTGRGEALVVRVGHARWAVPLAGLTGVVGLDALTPLPGAPGLVAGLAHVYGHVMTIVHLGVLLGEAPESPAAAMLVEIESGTFGLGVSAYESVISMPANAPSPAPLGLSDAARRYVEGVITTTGIGLLKLSAVVRDLSRIDSGGEEP